VIVVDNNCTDSTAKIASSLADRVITCVPQGISAARNEGAAKARGKWIAFVDADALVSPLWLSSVRPILQMDCIDAVSGWNFFRERNPMLFPYFNGYNAVFFAGFLLGLFFGKRLVVGNNLIIRRETLLAAGGFPPFVGEDVKLSAILHFHNARLTTCTNPIPSTMLLPQICRSRCRCLQIPTAQEQPMRTTLAQESRAPAGGFYYSTAPDLLCIACICLPQHS
jgi:cellulose synthase/poly-beta-1,6-N-acetylglucosamine synthase-like glycosyltransferase